MTLAQSGPWDSQKEPSDTSETECPKGRHRARHKGNAPRSGLILVLGMVVPGSAPDSTDSFVTVFTNHWVVGPEDGTVQLWNVVTGKFMRRS